jgi:hypothetical protein
MKDKIRMNSQNPGALEQLYREDKPGFESALEEVIAGGGQSELLNYWKIRLEYGKIQDTPKNIPKRDIFRLIAVSILTGFLIKLPDIFRFLPEESHFYERNTGIIVFFGLTLYLILNGTAVRMVRLVPVFVVFLLLTLYANLLPYTGESDTLTLVFIYLPLLLWYVSGFAYSGFDLKDSFKRIEYLKFNGDLAVLLALMAIAGGILTAVTINLFSAIGIDIEAFYSKNILITGGVVLPVISTFILKNYPALTGRIVSLIANIFSPLVLITAVSYLVALALSGKDPFTDREFLLLFNVMLLAVMAVIVFSVFGLSSGSTKRKFNEMILLALAVITVIIDLIALSAIVYRLGSFGITPNRVAVLGSNLLILVHLALIVTQMLKANFTGETIKSVEITIAKYLPVYFIWILLVVFGFPLIFGI